MQIFNNLVKIIKIVAVYYLINPVPPTQIESSLCLCYYNLQFMFTDIYFWKNNIVYKGPSVTTTHI